MAGNLFANIGKDKQRERSPEHEVYFASGDTMYSEEAFLEKLRSQGDDTSVNLQVVANDADLLRSISDSLSDPNVPEVVKLSVMSQVSTAFGYGLPQTTMASFKKSKVVTALSVGGFFRKIWEAILKFVRGFFKMIREFFNAVLGRDASTDKKQKENAKTLDYIRRNGLTIKPEDYRSIETRLLSILGMEERNVHPSVLMNKCEEMLVRYEKLFNEDFRVLGNTLETIFVPSMEGLVNLIESKATSSNDYDAITQAMMNLLNECITVTRNVLPKRPPAASIPEEIRQGLASRDLPYDQPGYEIVSFRDGKSNLLCNFSMLSVVPKEPLTIEKLNQMSRSDFGFVFVPFYTSKENLDTVILDPITSVNDLQDLTRMFAKTTNNIRINAVKDSINRSVSKIERMMNKLDKSMEAFSNKAEIVVKEDWSNRDIASALYNRGEEFGGEFVMTFRPNSDWLDDIILPEKPFDEVWQMCKDDTELLTDIENFKNNPQAMAMITGSDNHIPLTEDQIEVVAELPNNISAALQSSFQGMQGLLQGLVITNITLFDLYKSELTAYMQACISQFK